MPLLFRIRRDDRDFYAKADDGKEFFVGRRVPYKNNIGLYNIFARSPLQKMLYEASDFDATYGFWAKFVEPTAKCEGRNYLTLNTYDRARFTFGFGQFAAHVANGDFVLYFRELLGLPNAADYFPHLQIVSRHIHSDQGNGRLLPLETDDDTTELMNYLNPTLDEVEDSEVVAAAKLMHWTINDPAARMAQVTRMIAFFRSYMDAADHRLPLDGRPADQCVVVCDVLHHGRGGREAWKLLHAALVSSRPLEALIAIGTGEDEERRRTLRTALKGDAVFGQKAWNSQGRDFV